MKDKLGGRMIKNFFTLRPKMYSCKTDDDYVDKILKGTKNCVMKREIRFEVMIILKLQESLGSEAYNVFSEKVNKVALSANDDKKNYRRLMD